MGSLLATGVLAVVTSGANLLPVGPIAPVVIPRAPSPNWSWDRIPTSWHGAVKDRFFTDAEVGAGYT